MFVCQSLKRKSCLDSRLGQDSAPHSPPPIAIVMVSMVTPGPPGLLTLTSGLGKVECGEQRSLARPLPYLGKTCGPGRDWVYRLMMS